MKIIYEGFFVNSDIELPYTLDKDIDFRHITTEFKPAITHEHLYGQKIRVTLISYGNDSINEGVKVSLSSADSDELVELFNNIAIPHITLSVSNEGKPVNTSKLDFNQPIPDNLPEVIECSFGGYIGKPIFINPMEG